MLKTLLKVLIGIILFIVALVLALLLYVNHKITDSEQTATAFCDQVLIRGNIQNEIKRLNSNLSHRQYVTDDEDTVIHSFIVPGFIYSYYSCDVVATNNKVISRQVIGHDN